MKELLLGRFDFEPLDAVKPIEGPDGIDYRPIMLWWNDIGLKKHVGNIRAMDIANSHIMCKCRQHTCDHPKCEDYPYRCILTYFVK
jgi:hypothetical protein